MSGLILLTGATGFVGRQVLKALEAMHVRVRLVLRGGEHGDLSASPNIESIVTTQDLFSEPQANLLEMCAGVDIVVHVAWYAEPGKYLSSPKNMHCLTGTLSLAEAAAASGVKRFVGVGTCFEYDLNYPVLSTTTPLAPSTSYAGAKAAAYYGLNSWLPSLGVEFAWCRLFYLYGEAEDPRRLVPYLHSKLQAGENVELTKGDQIRDFMDVARAGKMIAELALTNKQGAHNICSGIPVSIRQLAEQIADIYGRRDLLVFGAREENEVDPACVLGVV
jgi:dTDP-6-deoxy-L-talose 4-dehydrogenase (NAD+)